MRLPLRSLALALSLQAGVSAPAFAEDAAPGKVAATTRAPFPATVTASLSTDRVTTADRLTLTITIEAPPGWRADPVDLAPSLPEGWTSSAAPSKTTPASGRERTAFAFDLVPFLPGDFEIKPVRVVLRPVVQKSAGVAPAPTTAAPTAPTVPAPDATPITLETAPLKVSVASVLPADEADPSLADIKSPVTPREPLNWVLIASIAVAIVAGLWAFKVLRARAARLAAERTVSLPAHEIALSRLAALERKDLLAPGRERFKAFFDEASAILREYIEDRFSIRAPESTTPEFLADARRSAALSPDDVSLLEKFLGVCDLVKFARHTPDAGDALRATTTVREFVERTRAPEARVIIEGPGAVRPRLLPRPEAA